MESEPDSLKNMIQTTMTSDMQLILPHGNDRKEQSNALKPTGKNKSALDTFENVIGGRERLVDILSLATLDKRQQHLLRLLQDPSRKKDSLALIARDSGLRPTDVLELFRASSLAASHAIVSSQLTEALPPIIKDITDKSVDARIECPHCQGEPVDEGRCPYCLGKGTIFRPSDLDRQKIVLEATGVLKKGNGVNVNVQQNNVNSVQPNNFFSKFVKNSDETAYDVEAIDVTPAEETDV